MNIKEHISFRTDEESLGDTYKSFSEKAKNQSKETQSLIANIINYYETIIRCMPGNVYWMDENARTLGCNQNVLDTFSLHSPSQFYGLTFDDLAKLGYWTENQGESFKKDTHEVLQTGLPKINIEEPPIIGPSAEETYFLTSRVPLFNNNDHVIGVVGISTDITDKKIAEKNLLDAKIRLEKAGEAKTEFIANISHDLRTSLTGILGLSQSLEKRSQDETNRADARLLLNATQQMLEVINNIVEAIEIEADLGEIQEAQFNMIKVVKNNLSLFAPAARDKNLSINFIHPENVPQFLIGNRFYFDRIILNLLGNAIKFTHDGSINIKISVDSETKTEVLLKMIIEDTGIGIPGDKFEVIFEYFSRLSPAFKGRYQGLGIGLYTVKKYLEKMSGRIEVKSQVGKGSQFTVFIPLKRPEPNSTLELEDAPAETYLPTKQHSATVLLVEDHPLASRMAAEIIRNAGCHVTAVSSGEDALKQLEKETYDLIFLDIGLPGIDGFETAKQIRHNPNPEIANIPIIALTAHMTKKESSSCKKTGMQEMLIKPITPVLVDYVFEKLFPCKTETQ
jgi:two-component system aerobic respiration control sensor histidine kinase ArcB